MPQARSYGLGFRRSPSLVNITHLPGESKAQKLRRWAYERKAARKKKYLMLNINKHRQLQPGALLPRLVRPEPGL